MEPGGKFLYFIPAATVLIGVYRSFGLQVRFLWTGSFNFRNTHELLHVMAHSSY
jgi:hypothetical protein